MASETSTKATITRNGTFNDADRAHQGSGNMAIVARPDGVVEAQFSGFEVTNGPDLEVRLSAHPYPTSSGDVSGAAWISHGLLKGNGCDQAYAIPAGTTTADHPFIVIWREQFVVLFSPANLPPVG